MFESLFWRQLQATVERIVLIKLRSKLNLFFEIFMPLYFVAILAIIQRSIPDSVVDAVNETQTVGRILATDVPRSIAVVPNNSDTRGFVLDMEKIAKQELNVVYFHDEETMLNAYRNNASRFVSAVTFSEKLHRNGSYTMYFPTEEIPNIAVLNGNPGDCRNISVSTCPPIKYLSSGFIQLQTLIDSTFIKIHSNITPSFPEISLKLMPKPKALINPKQMRSLLPIYMVLALSTFVTYVVIAIVNDKEKKIQESMKIMGLINTVYWLSWFLVYGIFLVFIALVISILIKVCEILVLSNVFLIFCSLFLYGLSIITMSFMITPFFNSAKVAGAICNLMTIIFSCLYYITVYVDNVSPVVYWIISLLSPTALTLGLDQAVRSELSGDGLSFKNISDGSFPFAATLVMLAVDVVLYALLAFYFDSVVPGEYGRKRKPWFCFLPSFWCRRKNEPTSLTFNVLDSNLAEGNTCVDPASNLEMVPLELQGKEAIKLTDVKKVFRGRHKDDVAALKGVSLDIYEGQITALLGHNGAGKTTLINIMLGMIPQTEGIINIFGLDVSDCDNFSKIRRMIGFCCQSDIFFENLTVREHLRFYAKIKDVPFAQMNQEIDRVLHDIYLTTQENAQAESLSGGEKRQLSLAIALIGNPKIIILDEPTSGMDPYSRRHLWTLLQRIKSDKVILFSTHHMDEADIIADRKAILVNGCLWCVGSSLFLRNKFGSGYHLSVGVNETPDEEGIYSLIRSHIPEAKKIPSRGEELVYTLPLNVVSKFPTLLLAIDKVIDSGSTNELGIKRYALSMTSLEEIFLKLGEDDCENLLGAGKVPVDQKIQVRSLSYGDQTMPGFENSNNMENEITGENGEELFLLQCVKTNPNSRFQAFKAMLKIRFLIDLRLPKNIFIMVIFFVILTCISLYIMNSSSSSSSSQELNIKPPLYQHVDGTPPLLYNHSESKEKDLLVLLENINSSGVRTLEYTNPIEALLENTPHFFFLAIDAVDLYIQELKATAIYNDTGIHGLPTLMNILNNARLLSSVNDTQVPFLRLTVKNFPTSVLTLDNFSIMFLPIFFLGLTFTMIPFFFVIVDVVVDKENKMKHLLRINGISFFVYWGSFFCCHLSILAVCLLAISVTIMAFKITMFMTPGPMICFLIMYLLYLPVGLLFFYLLSFFFRKHQQALSLLWIFPNLLGLIPFIITVTVDLSSSSGPILHYIFSFIFALYPAFSNLYYISKVYMIHKLLKVEAKFTDYFCNEIVVTIFAMIFNIVFYCALIKLCDVYTMNGQIIPHKKRTHITIPSNSEEIENEDSDIKAEREFVESVNSKDIKELPLLINSLGKEYDSDDKEKHFWDKLTFKKEHTKNKKKVAVCNLYLTVHQNEVFGLLGLNGAGKTTTLRMIATDEKPTSGKITVDGFDPTLEPEKVHQHLGYCPQFDALWPNITLDEHLYFFAAARGLPSEQIPSILNNYMNGLRIKEHAHKRSITLSGGTRRKLSFAISMLGNSSIVLLDEPSTGMDPQSKRFLWNSIAASFRNSGRGCVLTTHSMEEADVLCGRIGIMIKGKLKCLGSGQHLKNKYGSSYLLEIQLSSNQPLQERFKKLKIFISYLFSTYIIQEEFGTFIKVSILQSNVRSLAKVFSHLEYAKTKLGIVYYSLSQSSLEQVFWKFARLQDIE